MQTVHASPNDEGQSEEFRTDRLKLNIQRLHALTKVYTLALVWFAAVVFAGLIFTRSSFTEILPHAYFYTALVAVNIAFYQYSHPKRHESTKTGKSLQWHEDMIRTYITFLLVMGAIISLFDQIQFHHVIVFMLNIVIASGFFRLSWREFSGPLLLGTAVLLIGMPSFQKDPEMLMGMYIQTSIFVPIFFVLSRVLYQNYLNNYENVSKLNVEIESNRQLSRQLAALNSRLEGLALVDDLTDIPNRRALYAHLDQHVFHDDETEPGIPFGLIMIDVDYFKEFNDHYGHSTGDEVLAAIGGVLKRVAEETSGFVARWGGEEFVYISAGKGKRDVLAVCERIQEEVRAMEIPHAYSSVSRYVTVSQGACSVTARNHDDVFSCLHQADNALYEVKGQGRNGYHYVDYVVRNGIQSGMQASQLSV